VLFAVRSGFAGALPRNHASMGRIPRYQLEGTFHHVTARATGGHALFVDDDDRTYFLALFRRSITRFRWRCHAYCLMGTHYHLIIEAPLEQLSRGMHRLNSLYAMGFNERHRRQGRLFADRFASYVVRDEAHFAAALEYVLQNPVKAGLCKRAADWSWSGLGSPL
jgi:REP element-mobilizing transposase RayT